MKITHYRNPLLLCALLGLLFLQSRTAFAGEIVRLRLAATTSVENSGLMDEILPDFEKQHHCRVELIAVGTGKALKLGQQGDVDILLVHAPEKENAFIKAGYGIDRRKVMYNDFVVVGPKDDPAGVVDSNNIQQAFQRIANAQVSFVSRGDESGTHSKEKSLWAASGFTPTEVPTLEIGQGMSATLNFADQKSAYALTDKATYLAMREKIDLQILFEGDPLLHNPYSVIRVNPDRHKHINTRLAQQFSRWIISRPTQERIGQFNKNGETLFNPFHLSP